MKQPNGSERWSELLGVKTSQPNLPKKSSGLDCEVGLSFAMLLTRFSQELCQRYCSARFLRSSNLF